MYTYRPPWIFSPPFFTLSQALGVDYKICNTQEHPLPYSFQFYLAKGECGQEMREGEKSKIKAFIPSLILY